MRNKLTRLCFDFDLELGLWSKSSKLKKMVFLTIESANKAEINILSARDTTRPGTKLGPRIMDNDGESMARDVHLGFRTNLAPLADAKFIFV